MKKSLLLSLVLLLVGVSAFAQTIIKGKIVDATTGETLPGASVILKGTKNAVLTSLDGSFTLKTTTTGSGNLVISYIGFLTKEVSVANSGEPENLDIIKLEANSQSMNEVVISAGLAIDRKTPVAVSTIRATEIESRSGNNEFPELLRRTPSTYVTKGSGGFGDSRINVRGFDTKNTAVMINGVPVNDMEGGTVYWSNWAGLMDVASSIQVQRGLGASKLSTGSVGGTINIITKPTELEKGGSFKQQVGNDGFVKNAISYSTGKMANGLALTFLGARTVGNGYIDGTKFEGWNYFLAAGYDINDKHTITLTATGAPQWHHQNSNTTPYQSYYGNPNNRGVTPRGERYNANWGTLAGEEYNMSKNYYHKPVFNLNHYWKINEKTNLNSIVYASFGRGGGTGANGGIGGKNVYNLPRTADSLIRYDDIRKYNSGGVVSDFAATAKSKEETGPYAGQYVNAAGTSTGITRRASVNSHNWYGAIINLSHNIIDGLTLNGGLDWRYYKGLHYRSADDLLGAAAYKDLNNSFENPAYVTEDNGHLDYDYNGFVNQIGGFVSAEYSNDLLDAFISGSANNTGYSRETLFFNGVNGKQKSKTYDYFAYSTKGGLNIKVTDNHNFFGNAGYFTRAPFFDIVFPNRNGSTQTLENSAAKNEKILGFELGYGLRTKFVNASINVYHTEWKDRAYRKQITVNNEPTSANISGINQLHRGVELELSSRPVSELELTAMVSLGDWKYKNDVNSVEYAVDGSEIPGSRTTLYLKDVKVGDAAQTTASFGASYQILKRLRIRADYFIADHLYASYQPQDRNVAPAAGQKARQAWELPSYQLLDGGLSYNFKLQGVSATLSLGVDNILDKSYISEAYTDIEYNNTIFNSTTNPLGNGADDFIIPGTKNASGKRNNVSIGFGRTWNAGLSIKF